MRVRVVSVLCASLVAFVGGCVDTQHTRDDRPMQTAVLNIVERETWGWQDDAANVPEHHIEKITIHHGGTKYEDDRDPEEYLRGLQSWSRSDKGWIDIPYHYVVDLQGAIYEARPLRYPGDTNTSYDPTGHALIQIVGNYDERKFTAEQLTAVIELSAMLAREYQVPVSDIRGHRDYAPGETACPGENIYQYLRDGTITERVARLLSEDARISLGVRALPDLSLRTRHRDRWLGSN